MELARRQNIPLVATNDTHYTTPEQYEAHDLLLCIQTASNLDTPGRMRFETNEFYLKPAAEMRRLFNSELPEAFDNTLRIAEQCNLKLDFDRLRLPHFEVPDGETEASWLRKECERGLLERYPALTDEIRHRLDYELGIIDRMGYSALLPDRGRLHALRAGAGDRAPPAGAARRARSCTYCARHHRRSIRSSTACRSSASSTPTG